MPSAWASTSLMSVSYCISTCPISLEAYFQEAGRAGRDGQKAYAVILYAKSDKTTLHKRVVDTFPDKEYILNVYEHLQYYYQMAMGDGFQCVREFNLEEFCRKFKYFPVPVDSALEDTDSSRLSGIYGRTGQRFPYSFYDSPGRTVQTAGNGNGSGSSDTDDSPFLHRSVHRLCLYQRSHPVPYVPD